MGVPRGNAGHSSGLTAADSGPGAGRPACTECVADFDASPRAMTTLPCLSAGLPSLLADAWRSRRAGTPRSTRSSSRRTCASTTPRCCASTPVYQTLARHAHRAALRAGEQAKRRFAAVARRSGAVKGRAASRQRPTGRRRRTAVPVPVEREFRRPIAYDVDYVYKGAKFRSRLPDDPGNRLRMRVSVIARACPAAASR